MRKQVLLILCCVLCIGEVSAQFNKAGYYRVRNSITNNCICVIGDKYRESTDPDAFDQSIRLKPVADCYSDPASVIYINKLSNATLKAQGTDTYGISGMYLDIVKSGDLYIPQKDYYIFTMYAQEYPKGWLDVGQGDTYAKYYLDPLDYTNNTTKRDECYFGAKCAEKMENGGKYYTSMYTSFPYECIDGVNAYYVDGIENGIVHCVPVPNNKVPSNTGVILECNTPNDPAHNRLIPLLSEPAKISGNLLKGVFFNYDGTGYNRTTDPNRTAYDKNTMRVFSVSKTTGKIGFYQYSGSYLGANKAYLKYDFSNAHSNSFDSELTMNFDNTMSGVNEVHVEETVKDDRYYDLQGRVVEHPTRGIYIRNGRKVYVN